MAEQKKIIIKINHPNKVKKAGYKPEDEIQITEWNIKRIIIVALIILLLIVLPYIYLDEGQSDNDEQAPAKVEQEFSGENSGQAAKPEKVDTDINNSKEGEVDSGIAVASTSSKLNSDSQNDEDESSQRTERHYQVVRALLTSGIHNHQPMDELVSPIMVTKRKATGIFYYTELKNMKGIRLYHQWLLEGKEKLKTPFLVKQIHWRVSTSKLFTPASEGDWTVRLIDQEGRVYHKLNFKVKSR